MRTKLLMLSLSLCFISCSVDPVSEELENNRILEMNASGNSLCETVDAGPDKSISITYAEAAAIESWDEVRKLYLSLLEPEVPKDGSFDPTIWDIINLFQEQGVGEYTTRYTIMEGECEDSVLLTVNVVPEQRTEPCEELVDAGPDNSISISYSEAAAIESWDEVRKLYLSLLASQVSREGTFDPTIWDIINLFQEQGVGEYTTRYTVVEGDCEDSVLLTVNVLPDGQGTDPCGNIVDAGPDNSISISYSEAAAIESWDEVRKLYLNLLASGVSREGTFDPSIWDIINLFNVQGVGEYSTNYTVVNGDCEDSVLLTVIVLPDGQGTEPCEMVVDAGPDNSLSISYSEAAAIESWDEVRKLYLSLLAPGVSREGTFDPSIWNIINRFQEQGVGEYSTIYTVGEGNCKDSVNLTVIVTP